MSVSPVERGDLEIVPEKAPFGAAGHGVDLRRPLSGFDLERLRESVERRLVVVFRDQPLDDDQHAALAAQFGELLPQPIAAARGESGPVTVVRNDAVRRPGNAAWHSDLSWLRFPPGLAVLRAVRIPEVGGDTLWADMRAVWEGLPEAWRHRVRSLRALHDFDPSIGRRLRRIDGSARHRRLRESFPAVAHPVVRKHPTTGHLALFASEAFTSRVVGVSDTESEEILRYLFARTRETPAQIRHRWREGDVVIWDERSTVHFAMADHYPAEREVRRITIAGDRPV